MRGKPPENIDLKGGKRITPACAGKTGHITDNPRKFKDHPRVCGENAIISEALNSVSGSPPRVRGKLHKRGLLRGSLGITPACAGKTTLAGADGAGG